MFLHKTERLIPNLGAMKRVEVVCHSGPFGLQDVRETNAQIKFGIFIALYYLCTIR